MHLVGIFGCLWGKWLGPCPSQIICEKLFMVYKKKKHLFLTNIKDEDRKQENFFVLFNIVRYEYIYWILVT